MTTAVEILPSGRVVALEMPDLYGILATVGRVPSQHMIDVLNLLVADGAWSPAEADADKYLSKRNTIRGYYAVAALCLQSPRLILDRAPNPAADEIGPTDLNWRDVEAVYHGFFRGWMLTAPAEPAGPADAGRAAGAAPDVQGVRDNAEPVSGGG